MEDTGSKVAWRILRKVMLGIAVMFIAISAASMLRPRECAFGSLATPFVTVHLIVDSSGWGLLLDLYQRRASHWRTWFELSAPFAPIIDSVEQPETVNEIRANNGTVWQFIGVGIYYVTGFARNMFQIYVTLRHWTTALFFTSLVSVMLLRSRAPGICQKSNKNEEISHSLSEKHDK